VRCRADGFKPAIITCTSSTYQYTLPLVIHIVSSFIMPLVMGMRSVSCVIVCILSRTLAQLSVRGDRSGHAGMIDSRLMQQILLEDGENTSGRQPIPEALNGGRSHEQNMRFPRKLDPPGSEFRRCGEVWERYEQVAWGANKSLQHHAVCASASDNMSIGICRSDGVGHDNWEYCASPPPSRCEGYGKLYFVLCEDVTRVSVPPEEVPPNLRDFKKNRTNVTSRGPTEEALRTKAIEEGVRRSLEREEHQGLPGHGKLQGRK